MISILSPIGPVTWGEPDPKKEIVDDSLSLKLVDEISELSKL